MNADDTNPADPSPEMQQAAPEPQPPTAQPPTMPAEEPAHVPERRHGCLISIIVAAVVLILLIGGTLFVVVRQAKQKNLGVTYTEADYWNAAAKAGLKYASPPVADDFAARNMAYSGGHPVDITFTPAEVSALFNYSHMTGWPVKNAQVRFTGGNGVEISAIVPYQGVEVPVYIAGTASMTGKVVSAEVTTMQVAGTMASGQTLSAMTSLVLRAVNDRLSRLSDLDITKAEVVNGNLHVVGTVPTDATSSPK